MSHEPAPISHDPAHWTRHVTSVPATDHYPGVDELLDSFRELAARYPALITERRIGTSRLGEPLYCFTVGAGASDLVVVGGVHPNEPVGAVTALHLASSLCADDALRGRYGATWHIVPCIDPDGARLNEDWFQAPADRIRYGRSFYRPPGHEQVEWTFPFSYRDAYFDAALPETFALMRLIDATRPRFLSTLHNCEEGGVYYYLNRPAPALYATLAEIPTAAGLPLATGEPEAPHVPVYAPAVYGSIDMRAAYDYLEAHGDDPAARIAGASSASYAEPYGTFYFVTEVPHWSHPDADDPTPTPERYPEILRERATALREAGAFLKDVLDAAEPYLTIDSPFLRATKSFAPGLIADADVEAARAAAAEDRPATVSERYSCRASVHSCRIRFGGMLLRALAAELAAGTAPPAVRRLHRRLAERYQDWEKDAEPLHGSPIPIAALAGVQYAALLAAADHAVHGD
ncbi:M14 family zinc carboxypeptidase [Streptomyces boninensis]|uniref:M14 family zinc carboxypeptidase n=1 Tax=Streptomyces boninensis TaxID=2039455 RepID=UPI003B20E4A5